eukprot:gnl/MRDRNA2_/MRDRNA2_86395_c0_seq3.p1 gnl/MRDRNA2_/MRDRNA2_86395_c0~~gnl/MRDRNA2_/MRDRNA2_86395_c0_seq3.p1  ORF type:complete len:973 (+),score=303.77 gnl/MRDRNA2_/MRDRNA2_86395_c0_seq3:77-2995(+)
MGEEALNPNWVELQTEDGRTYFWHRGDGSRSWSLPAGSKALWVSQKTPDGRMYYWSRETKEVTWSLPKLEPTAQLDTEKGSGNGSELQQNLLSTLQKSIDGSKTAGADDADGGSNTSSPSDAGDDAGQNEQKNSENAKEAAGHVEEVKTEERADDSTEDEDEVKEDPKKEAEMKDEAKEEAQQEAKEELQEDVKEEIQEEEKDEEEEEEEPDDEPDPGVPGPLGDSASAVAARHLMEKSPCDSWFTQVASHGKSKDSGGWEEVLKFWPPKRRKKLKAPTPATGEGNDPFGLKPLVRHCRLHENRVRALLAAADGSDMDYSAERYPAPQFGDSCYWTLNGSQLTVDQDGKGAAIQRNPPDGGRWRLMKNSLRSRLSMVFQANKLQDLETTIRLHQTKTKPMQKKNSAKVQALLDKLPDIPEALLKAAQEIAGPKEDLAAKAEAFGARGKTSSISTAVEPVAKAKSAPKLAEAKKEPEIQKTPAKKEEPVKEKKVSEPVAFKPKRTGDDDANAPWRKRRRQKEAEKDVQLDPVEVRKERLQRIIVVDNVPPKSSTSEITDFFTGAVFSGAGHPIAAQWQSGTASKVVLKVDLNASKAEVTFGTHLAATVALSLNGIMLNKHSLAMRRPDGYEGKGDTPPKIALKDLVASETVERAEARLAAEKASGDEGGKGKSVLIKGVPPSMSESSVRDLLVQFGGSLSSLFLQKNSKTTLHTGEGVAEFDTREAALEAVRFSPLLGFIEIRIEKAGEHLPDPVVLAAPSTGVEAFPKASANPAGTDRKSKLRGWEDQDDEEDLGPFEAVLKNRAPLPSKEAPSEDLGPFEAVLSAQKKTPAKIALEKAQARRFREAEKSIKGARADEDLGPFEAVLPSSTVPKVPVEEDLGPFESVLPMAPAKGFAKRPREQVLLPMAPAKVQKSNPTGGLSGTKPAKDEDLGPFEAVLTQSTTAVNKEMQKDVDLDLGPFAEALAGLPKR